MAEKSLESEIDKLDIVLERAEKLFLSEFATYKRPWEPLSFGSFAVFLVSIVNLIWSDDPLGARFTLAMLALVIWGVLGSVKPRLAAAQGRFLVPRMLAVRNAVDSARHAVEEYGLRQTELELLARTGADAERIEALSTWLDTASTVIKKVVSDCLLYVDVQNLDIGWRYDLKALTTQFSGWQP